MSVWLQKVLGDDIKPQYKISPHTVDILHQLMLRNEKQDNYTQLLVKDYNQKAEEYTVEGDLNVLILLHLQY